MNKLISANYWFGCDWVFYEVDYLGLRAGQLSLACAVVYLWNTGYLRVTRPRLYPGIQQFHEFDGEESLFLIFVYHFLENVISECHGNSSCMIKPYPQQTNLSHNVDNSLYVCSYLVHSMHDATNFIVLDLPLLEIVSFATNDNCT